MKKSKKTLLGFVTVALTAAVALPVATSAIRVSGASVNGEPLYKENFEQIENEVWFNDDFTYYYGASDEFPYPVASMEAWITLDTNVALGTDYGVIFSNYNSFAGSAAEYEFRVTADRHLKFYSAVDGYTYTFDEAVIPIGEKVHIAFVYDMYESALKLYINGALVQTENDITLLDSVTHLKYRVGTNEGGLANANALKGTVHQVTVYGSPIDEETIALDMVETDISAEERAGLDLMANWVMTDERAWKVEDTSGNDNHLLYQTQGAYVDAEFSDKIDYSFVMIPDTQGLVIWQHERFEATVNWIKEKKEELNIAYVMHMGDIINNVEPQTQNPEDELNTQWTTARRCMNELDGVVPYSLVLGNHDYDMQYGNITTRDTNYFNTYFPYSKYSQREDFGGAFEANKMDNVYYTFTAGGAKYMLFALEYSPRTNVLTWANKIIKENPDHRVIITTHALLGTDRYYNYNSASALHGQEANDGIEVWDQLVTQNSNVMMTFSGHESQHNLTMRLDTGLKGNKVFSMLVDFQSFHAGHLSPAYQYDEAFITVLGFDEDEQKTYIYLVNAETNKLYNAQNCIVYDFADENNSALNGSYASGGENNTGGEEEPKSGCASSLSMGFAGVGVALSLGVATISKKRKIK